MQEDYSGKYEHILLRKQILLQTLPTQLSKHPVLLNPIYGINQKALVLPLLKNIKQQNNHRFLIDKSLLQTLEIITDPHFENIHKQLQKFKKMKNGDIGVTCHSFLRTRFIFWVYYNDDQDFFADENFYSLKKIFQQSNHQGIKELIIPITSFLMGRDSFKEFGILTKKLSKCLRRELMDLSNVAP